MATGSEYDLDPVVKQYVKAILSSLEHDETDNAIILAERFAAARPNRKEPMYLMAKAHALAGAKNVAVQILEQQLNYPPARFLYARCCFELDRLADAERALQTLVEQAKYGLDKVSGPWLGKTLEISQVQFLLGKVQRRMSNFVKAKQSFDAAFNLDPLLWSAFQNLCELDLEPTGTFKKSKKRKRHADDIDTEPEGSSEEGTDTEEGKQCLLQDSVSLGKGFRALHAYNSKTALESLREVNEQQYNTAWTYCQIARAHYELTEYTKAVRAFQKARAFQPWLIESMDVYGSCLWHLKKDYELAALAKDMEALDRLAPQTWSVIGNFYSLKQEHQTAIQCFERAIQIDPHYDYAYTLLGHEFMAIEELEKAASWFWKARSRNPRSFNAWFAMGKVRDQQNKHEQAWKCYLQAENLNKNNPTLYCHMAMLKQKKQEYETALELYVKAEQLDPNNPLYRFRTAYLQSVMGELDAALERLKELENASPLEVNVYFLQARIYKLKKLLPEARRALLKAQSFTKDPTVVRDALERLEGENEDPGAPNDLNMLGPQ
ncbi:hypothetical protein HK097_003533 [Rhizophlyctis rosea]|uniref:TPR-like protein n=1 Tax=Rhizophlyctis rosea TaxID=64517 RepID=A0AAD5SGD9_9FUNG|nr:hypothetical protein HK097_003533 [Rhizophlyctis rosea]